MIQLDLQQMIAKSQYKLNEVLNENLVYITWIAPDPGTGINAAKL